MESCSDDKKAITEPLLSSSSNRKGGIRALPFIIANEAFERLANYGLMPNLILYLTREYGMDAATAAQIINLYKFATNFTPILGAFIADTYVGRYPMIGFGCITSLLGMVLLWLTTIIPGARPPSCVEFGSSCTLATTSQLLLLYSSFILMAIGAGGIRSSSLAFGADQLPKKDNIKHDGILERYFGCYYAVSGVAIIIAMFCITYTQDVVGWNVGFGIPVVLMTFSALSFFLASPIYVKSEPKTSWLTGFAQVFVASFRKRSIELPSHVSERAYHHRKGSILLFPSEQLRFLNNGCVIANPEEDLNPDGIASDPWSLCTVDEVEELKALIKLIPIWSTGVLTSLNACQLSFVTLQASTMDRHITSKFVIPAGSFPAFLLLSSTIWVILYDRLIIPLASKIKGRPTRLSLKQRIGVGTLLSAISLAILAIVESVRRDMAIKEGVQDVPKAMVHISALWLLSYLVVAGIAEALNMIGQNELYYTGLPKTMSSVASNGSGIGVSSANLVASLVISLVRNFTKGEDGDSWVSSNMNKGHYDYYYWLIAGLSLVNFVYYLVCAKAYGPCRSEAATKMEGSADDDD